MGYERFRNGTEAVIETLLGTGIPFLAMEAPALIPRTDWMVKEVKDWRTNARLHEFNAITRKAMRGHDIEGDVIPMFDLPLAIVGTSQDWVHYQGWAREAMVKNVLHHACGKLSETLEDPVQGHETAAAEKSPTSTEV